MNEITPRFEVTPEYLAQQGLSESFPKRFWAKVDKTSSPNGCWLWTGATRPCGKRWPRGHGMIQRMEGMNWKIYSHRAAWILCVGPIPEGQDVLHRCPGGDVPSCCNPEHLMLGDQFVNMRQMTVDGHNYFANAIGTSHPKAKLTKEQVEFVQNKTDWKYGEASILAREWNVTPSCIYHISKHISHRRKSAE